MPDPSKIPQQPDVPPDPPLPPNEVPQPPPEVPSPSSPTPGPPPPQAYDDAATRRVSAQRRIHNGRCSCRL